jgi:MFS family permease
VLFLNIGTNTDYLTGMLPTFILAGIGFALTFGPLNMAATGGVAPEEQGLASGLVYTSFQVGGAIGLAIATAVIDAGTAASSSPAGSAAALLDGIPPGDPDLARHRCGRNRDHGGAAALTSSRPGAGDGDSRRSGVALPRADSHGRGVFPQAPRPSPV